MVSASRKLIKNLIREPKLFVKTSNEEEATTEKQLSYGIFFLES